LSLGTRRRVTQSSPVRSGSKANAVAVQAGGASYKGKSSTRVGTDEPEGPVGPLGIATPGSSGLSSGLELQFESESARATLSKLRPMASIAKG